MDMVVAHSKLESTAVIGRGIRRWVTPYHNSLWFESLVVVNKDSILNV
jgi:hypothetical protein